VERAEADVDVARNAYEFAALSVERRQKGLEERGVARIDLDAAESELRAKRAALRIAHVARRAAADQLHYTRIDSPIDGTVIDRAIGPGEVVTPGVQATFEGRALIAIADLSQLVVKTDVNQIDVAKLKVGQAVTVTLDALPGRTINARVTWIAPASVMAKDKQVDVFPVEATLETSDAAIKPGMVADVRVHVDKRVGVVILPIEAVVEQGGAHWVTTLTYGADGKPLRHLSKVEVGARNDREIEIVSGIAPGERVVVRPPSAADNEFKM
jgi:RND family efflux transporter MFP subunit